ncbi:MAG: hypothetical protein Q9200_000794 [Gallowayella weberi]
MPSRPNDLPPMRSASTPNIQDPIAANANGAGTRRYANGQVQPTVDSVPVPLIHKHDDDADDADDADDLDGSNEEDGQGEEDADEVEVAHLRARRARQNPKRSRTEKARREAAGLERVQRGEARVRANAEREARRSKAQERSNTQRTSSSCSWCIRTLESLAQEGKRQHSSSPAKTLGPDIQTGRLQHLINGYYQGGHSAQGLTLDSPAEKSL